MANADKAKCFINDTSGYAPPLQREVHPAMSTRAPARPLPHSSAPRVMVIGAGSRGCSYAKAFTYPAPKLGPTQVVPAMVVGVAEPHSGKRRRFVEKYILRQGNGEYEALDPAALGQIRDYMVVFTDWKEMITPEGKAQVLKAKIDGFLICRLRTLDDTHEEIILSLHKEYPNAHILSEKPLTTSAESVKRVYNGIGSQTLFAIGHVLRYSPLLDTLMRLVCIDEVVGEVVHVDWTEPVGYWHFAHSYVRGNWANTASSAPSLLTKCCHDIDMLMWLLSYPHYSNKDDTKREDSEVRPTHAGVPNKGVRKAAHAPSRIVSTGNTVLFRRSRKPAEAGTATNCFSCPAERECIYSAKKIYIDRSLKTNRSTGWPNKIVCPDIEDLTLPQDMQKAETLLTAALTEDYATPADRIPDKSYYGRCVWESHNDVCDSQVVTLTWDDETPTTPTNSQQSPSERGYTSKSATLTMMAHTSAICERRGRIYGTSGEISFDAQTNSIIVYDFKTQTTKLHTPSTNDSGDSHGGGDFGLANAFAGAIDAVKNKGWTVEKAQREWIGMTPRDAFWSHLVVWAAEEARTANDGNGKTVLWEEFIGRDQEAH